MKKWLLVVLILVLGLLFVVCFGFNSFDKKEDIKKEIISDKDKVLNYYMDLVDVVNENNGDYNVYVGVVGVDFKLFEVDFVVFVKLVSELVFKVFEVFVSEKILDFGKFIDDFKVVVK